MQLNTEENVPDIRLMESVDTERFSFVAVVHRCGGDVRPSVMARVCQSLQCLLSVCLAQSEMQTQAMRLFPEIGHIICCQIINCTF